MKLDDCVVAYLGGDSYPRDNRIENQVRRRLPARFIDHVSILNDYQNGRYTSQIAPRLETLRRLSDDLADHNLILIGRSSGARVITLHARSRPPGLRGLICLGYPFRNPNMPPDPARVAHLADLTVPTLIVQGTADNYGGADVPASYALSPHILFRLVEAPHTFAVRPNVWDEIGRHMRDFIEAL